MEALLPALSGLRLGAPTGAPKKRAKPTVRPFYGILQLEPDAHPDDIRRNYLLLSRKVHPDKNPGDAQAASRFIQLKEAYDTLSDPDKRARYDRGGSAGDDSAAFAEAYAFFRGTPIDTDDIDAYLDGYRGSVVEEEDLLAFFKEQDGDLSQLLGYIIGSRDEDVPRYLRFYEQAIKDGRLPRKYANRKKYPFTVTPEAELGGAPLFEPDDDEEEDDDEDERETARDLLRTLMMKNLTGMPAGGSPAQALGPDYQAHLLREGWVVIPTALGSDREKLDSVRDAFDLHIDQSPELLNPRPEDPTWKNVLGGFAALGNPSSFHHKFVRKMREMCEAAVLDHDALPLNGRRLEQCFDRMMRRIPGESTDAESWHRDEALNTQAGDDLFGGWINLDTEPQFFSCAPGTHNEEGARDRNAGFAKITSPEEKSHYQAIADEHGLVEIPPGHILIFYERLVHEVLKVTATRIMRRLFLGWRATSAREPLFGQEQTNAWIDSQAPPKIKSGQKPAIYPSAYYNFPRNFQTLTDFSESVFVPQCLYQHVVRTGAQAGTAWTRVERYMKGLADYGLPMHPAYQPEERKIMFPSRRVQLHTFDDPGGPRVAYRVASVSEWEEYEGPRVFTIDEYGNPGRLGRPRPERV